MSPLLVQILSGAVVAIISFGFGYFLFRSQTNEAIRLEVYRRRLNSYEQIQRFVQDLDVFAHNPTLCSFADKREAFIRRGFDLSYTLRPYLTSELDIALSALVQSIDSLPGDVSGVENLTIEIEHNIDKDIGAHLINRHVQILGKRGLARLDTHFSNNEVTRVSENSEPREAGSNVDERPF